ncbi:MAG: hypothetical protein ACE5JM_02495 [Armatimonadota bacterium]
MTIWALVRGSWGLLQWAGQMPHTVYEEFGFREVKRLRDPRLQQHLAHITDTAEDPSTLRVMVLTRSGEGT